MVLGKYWRNKFRYTKNRFILAHVCSQWRAVVFADQALWNSMDVTVDTPTNRVEFYLARIPSTQIDLRLKLHRGGVNSVATTVTYFLHTLRRCRSLWIKIMDAQSLHLVAANISDVSFDNLRILHLQCAAPQKQLLVPIVAVSSPLDQVRSLRLRRVWFKWDVASTLTSLTTLVLRDIYIQFAPEWCFWDTITTTSPLLERLSIRHVGCRDIPPTPRTLSLAHLSHMDLAFGTTTQSMFRLIAAIYAPSLTHLNFAAESSASLISMSTFPDMLQNVKEITLRIDDVDIHDMHRFLTLTPRVHFLDLLDNESTILDSMCIPRKPIVGDYGTGEFVCPALEVLAVEDEQPSSIKAFMEARIAVANNMKLVLFRLGLGEEKYDEDFDWIEERVRVGLGKEFVHPYWLTDEEPWLEP